MALSTASFMGQCVKVIEHRKLGLAISCEIGDWQGKKGDLGNLGTGYFLLRQYQKATERTKQVLEISHEIGNQKRERN